jgi:hypothetical protein
MKFEDDIKTEEDSQSDIEISESIFSNLTHFRNSPRNQLYIMSDKERQCLIDRMLRFNEMNLKKEKV